jgi:hypothetical protein
MFEMFTHTMDTSTSLSQPQFFSMNWAVGITGGAVHHHLLMRYSRGEMGGIVPADQLEGLAVEGHAFKRERLAA